MILEAHPHQFMVIVPAAARTLFPPPGHSTRRRDRCPTPSGGPACGSTSKCLSVLIPSPVLWRFRLDLRFLSRILGPVQAPATPQQTENPPARSEEHTSELQSRQYLVCR